jgi:hypothetical protein
VNQPVEPNRPDDARDRPTTDRRAALQDPLVRFDARVLDPTTAVRLTNGEQPSPTVYVGDTLLVTAADRAEAEELLEALAKAVDSTDLPLEWVRDNPFRENDDPDHDQRARLLNLAAEQKLPLVFPARFVSSTNRPAPAVDVWPLLQAIRQLGRDGDDQAKRLSAAVGLNHLMSAAADISGNPFMRGTAAIFGNPFMRGTATIGGNPFMRGTASGVASYAAAGSGGRGPVSVVLQPPLRRPKTERPHVVVLDTGVGAHPWFVAQAVQAGLQYKDLGGQLQWIGKDPSDPEVELTDPEGKGAIPDPMTGLLGSHSGHGTFIAGLLRQTCAEADITAVRVMDADGVVPELILTDALLGLGVVQSQALAKPDEVQAIDAVVLSLGYYSETGDDVTYTAGLRNLIITLASMAVAVFCAAGNDSTLLRSYPAAFADDPAFKGGSCLPVASVAALNPDLTVALFSNEGDWVNAEAPGVNVVSTAPTSAAGAWMQDTYFVGPRKTHRGTIDPDAFVAGFSTWSGTSFAAPVLAGRYLATLAEKPIPRSVADRRSLIGLGRTASGG